MVSAVLVLCENNIENTSIAKKYICPYDLHRIIKILVPYSQEQHLVSSLLKLK